MLTLCTYGTFVRAASLPSEAETGDILQPDPAIQTTLITRQLRIGQLDTEKKETRLQGSFVCLSRFFDNAKNKLSNRPSVVYLIR
jgi:hypothetical protein